MLHWQRDNLGREKKGEEDWGKAIERNETGIDKTAQKKRVCHNHKVALRWQEDSRIWILAMARPFLWLTCISKALLAY